MSIFVGLDWGGSSHAVCIVDPAGKVLDRELSPDDHRRLIEQAMAELPAASSFATTNGRGA